MTHMTRSLNANLSALWRLLAICIALCSLSCPAAADAASASDSPANPSIVRLRLSVVPPDSAASTATAPSSNVADPSAQLAPVTGGMVLVNMTAFSPITMHGIIDLPLPIHPTFSTRHRLSLNHPAYLQGQARRHGHCYGSTTHVVRATWVALAPRKYFEERPGFNPLSMLKSPMMFMPVLSLGLLFVLPKLSAMLDEAKAEANGGEKKDEQSALARQFKSL
ncbi:hypothetical protein BCR44DRAFT_1513385 [Catenaria anguillulae PL171]|uniref:ER membrane protein complex subunit 7 beta-sandwich domain-containing protein n=1 Tax=Catenaria anguillulae PL171 TaxID=765915 RepID=A0A1Y2HNG9_9FUNG|nr:hypothetical protein BCR44DRAFT_1513385 [Catenaria anguillulae PL171]